jgi:hypothetical protein
MNKQEVARSEVSLARAHNWLAVRYAKAGYPDEARRTRGMRKHHMSEARYAAKNTVAVARPD